MPLLSQYHTSVITPLYGMVDPLAWRRVGGRQGVGLKPDPREEHMRTAMTETEELTWQRFANCLGVDPDLFFPERGASTREAKEVCRACVVRADCLEYAITNGEKFGIWGGLSERERRRIRRARALANANVEIGRAHV